MSRFMLNRLLTYLQYKILRLERKGFKFQFKDAYATYRRKPVIIDVILITPDGYIYNYVWDGDTFQSQDMYNTFRMFLNAVEKKDDKAEPYRKASKRQGKKAN